MNYRSFIKIIITLSILICSITSYSQDFLIPPEASKKVAPFLFTDATQKSGETIYNLNCKSCHGEPGKANFANLVPIPKDPASPDYQKNTDGDMFYILTVGKGLMPTFASTLSEEQRWQVISYIRSFNKNYKQPPIQIAAESEVSSSMSITFYVDSINKIISTIVADSSSGRLQPVNDLKVSLFIKRTFGNLPIGEKTTNELGVAQFDFPLDVPGDNQGYLILIAKSGKSGQEITKDSKLKVGKATSPKNILDQRAWWNINAKAPIWLFVLYFGGLLIVLMILGYILLQLKKIRDINHKA